MNLLLVSALFQSGLAGFVFYPSPMQSQTAGHAFPIVIVAVDSSADTWQFNFNAELSTTYGNQYVSPNTIVFTMGVCSVSPTVYLATDTIRLICRKGIISSSSDPFRVIAANPFRYVTLVPGESLNQGTVGSGRIGTPVNQVAGVPCTLTTYLTDNWTNPVQLFRNDSLILRCNNDPFAQFPPNPRLSNGYGRFVTTFRKAGTDRVYTYPKGINGIKGDTSSQFSVLRGPFSSIIPLLPGETLVPGDTTTFAFATPGKTGGTGRVYVKDRFVVHVVATDDCWNPDTTPSSPRDSVTLVSDFAYGCTLAMSVLRDTGTTFRFHFDATGDNQTIWAWDKTRNISSLKTMVNVVAKAESILVIMQPVPHDPVRPDTVTAGRIVTFKVSVLDANLAPIPAKHIQAVVAKGNGLFYNPTPDSLNPDSFNMWSETTWAISDTSGTALFRFTCNRASNDEWDTLEFSADGHITRKGIYVLTDPDVGLGKLIAFPNPLGLGGPTATIEYMLPSTADQMTVAIYDPFGNEVWMKKFRRGEMGDINGVNRVTWDGRTAGGRRVASGVYELRVWGLVFTDRPYNKRYRLGVLWPE